MYTIKNFTDLFGIHGFSKTLLETHLGLYEGYVKNTNIVFEKLQSLEPGTPEYAELKRRFGWEFNGMRLHELYFENMKKEKNTLDNNSAFYQKIEKDFSSYENWEKDFMSTGALRGIGWAIFVYDKDGDKLFNTWINEHDAGHLAGAIPLLVMDVFEHAFIADYGMKRADYIGAFMSVIDWETVSKRFR